MKKVILILVGIILSFVCLELVLQTTSFVIAGIVKYKNFKVFETKLKDNDTITILCTGESTTYEQWPVQLEQYLKENSNKKFNIVTSALPSIDINGLLERTLKMVEEYKPDIVISMMGINNTTFEKQKEPIYKKHKLKTIDLFYLIKKHLQNKIFADNETNDKNYYLELVDKYKNNNETPFEFLEILKKQPNNKDALIELIFLYHERQDIENVKKYINIFIEKYPGLIDNKVFVTALSDYPYWNIEEYGYTDFNNILLYLIENKENVPKSNLNEIFKNSLGFSFNLIKLEELEYIYNLLIDNKIDTYIIVDIYNYLLENNIHVKYPNYDISFSKEPNFNKEEIKMAYIELANTLKKKEIIYICMGYPTININVLKNLFTGTNLGKSIIFVSNEQNFNNYLKNNEYFSIFRDKFAGIFGHCNNLGNTMIAENVGKVILELTNNK